MANRKHHWYKKLLSLRYAQQKALVQDISQSKQASQQPDSLQSTAGVLAKQIRQNSILNIGYADIDAALLMAS